MDYKKTIEEYVPVNLQEESDKGYMLEMISLLGDKSLTREAINAHFTASVWITNRTHDKILMNWHNIYKNWGWLGGHNDGDPDFLNVALKEAHEESGLKNLKVLSDKPISLEILPVPYHVKRGRFVSSHVHMNLTYLLEADEEEPLTIKPDENSGLKWVMMDDAPVITNEDAMKPVYRKLNDALRKLTK